MSQTKQDHSNSYYFNHFQLDYGYGELFGLNRQLKTLVDAKEIYGFGIYRKSDGDSQKPNEFTIVIKLKNVRSKNLIQMTYEITEKNKYHRTMKKGDMGPIELYNELIKRGYEMHMVQPKQVSDINVIITDDKLIWEDSDIEYNYNSQQILKFDGGKNSSRKKNTRRLRKSKKYF